MVTRDYLEKEGFKRDHTAPSSVEDFYTKIRPYGGYISVRFNAGGENAVGLFAYAQDPSNSNVRKVVLSETIVTKEDLEMARKICRL